MEIYIYNLNIKNIEYYNLINIIKNINTVLKKYIINSKIERNKQLMKKFETMICHKDQVYQEKLSEELIDSKASFNTPISPNPLYGGKGYLSVVFLLRKSFSDIQWKIVDMVVDEDKAAVTWELTATHDGDFMGKKPTGKKIKVCVMNFYYINKEGKIYKDVAAEGMIRILKTLGLVNA